MQHTTALHFRKYFRMAEPCCVANLHLTSECRPSTRDRCTSITYVDRWNSFHKTHGCTQNNSPPSTRKSFTMLLTKSDIPLLWRDWRFHTCKYIRSPTHPTDQTASDKTNVVGHSVTQTVWHWLYDYQHFMHQNEITHIHLSVFQQHLAKSHMVSILEI